MHAKILTDEPKAHTHQVFTYRTWGVAGGLVTHGGGGHWCHTGDTLFALSYHPQSSANMVYSAYSKVTRAEK